MNFEVHFSSAAQDDIDQIFDYISVHFVRLSRQRISWEKFRNRRYIARLLLQTRNKIAFNTTYISNTGEYKKIDPLV